MNRGWVTCSVLLALSLLLSPRPPSAAPAATYVGSDACGQCHEDRFREFAANPHGRAARDGALIADRTGCESCHGPGSLHVEAAGDKSNPGFATVRNFRATPAADVVSVCTTCHRAGEQFYWEESAHSHHDVSCTQCHSIHHSLDSEHDKLLKAEGVNRLCLGCHKSKRMELARSAHMPLTEGGMNCAECHNPHGSPGPHMERAASANELCYKCHADKRGPMLWEHAPVRENCLNCHEPHGANADKLLAAKRPFLCQRCHITTRHPSTLYDGSDLATNRLLNRSCTNCHSQIHGSNDPSGNLFLR